MRRRKAARTRKSEPRPRIGQSFRWTDGYSVRRNGRQRAACRARDRRSSCFGGDPDPARACLGRRGMAGWSGGADRRQSADHRQLDRAGLSAADPAWPRLADLRPHVAPRDRALHAARSPRCAPKAPRSKACLAIVATRLEENHTPADQRGGQADVARRRGGRPARPGRALSRQGKRQARQEIGSARKRPPTPPRSISACCCTICRAPRSRRARLPRR